MDRPSMQQDDHEAHNMPSSQYAGDTLPIIPMVGPPGLGNPDPRDHIPYKPPADRPIRRTGTPS